MAQLSSPAYDKRAVRKGSYMFVQRSRLILATTKALYD